METKIESGKLIISIPIEPPRPSASGKTLVVASSRGNKETQVAIDGKPVYLSLNAYVYAKAKRGKEVIVKAELV